MYSYNWIDFFTVTQLSTTTKTSTVDMISEWVYFMVLITVRINKWSADSRIEKKNAGAIENDNSLSLSSDLSAVVLW